MKNIDVLIIGAGPVGCVLAEQLATKNNQKILIVEKRNHIAGNCFDRYHESGVMIHEYGPHYFRTNKIEVLNYLSKYTEWIPGNYKVKSYSRGELFPFPINILTLEQFFNVKLTTEEAKKLLASLGEDYANPKNSEEFVLSRVGKELYEAFYLGYTLKQWEMHPKDLDASVCGRIPIRFNKDERYVDHKFQLTPKHGFTKLFGNMINHKNIHVLLNTDYKEIIKDVNPKFVIYTGPIDYYFDNKFGKLPWRSLSFNHVEYNKEFEQPCVQINYPNDFKYTRSVEIKHVTQQKTPNTIVSYEFSEKEGDPYYPIPAEENKKLFLKYKELAELETKEKNVYFGGRLANYTYINTDEAIENALELYNKIVNEQNLG
jgi:UDP-galactopyranose mutase